MASQTDGSLWPGVFGWGVVGASGLMYGGPVWALIGTLAGILSVVMAGVQLWPGDDPPRAVQAMRAAGGGRRRPAGRRRCRARDPQRCRHPRCPEGHGVTRGGMGRT